MATVNRIPFNTIPQEWAFHPTIGPFVRDLLTIIWQQRNRTGGDSDAIGDYEVRITSLENADVVLDSRLDTAEADITSLEADVVALEAEDIAIDARLDALEAEDIAIDARLDALEAEDIAIDARLDALEAEDIAIDARLDALEAAPGTHADTVEHDFGTAPVYEAQFTITDAAITATSVVNVVPGGAATGRTADDWQWDGAIVGVVPGTGSATCYVTFHPGPIVGPRTFNYTVI